MAGWKTVRVFISSTFRDMHAERDYLVKRVFPAMRERLEEHRIHLIDIDLRWGVTQEQADNDQALDLCLDLIDECRPFFIGILGERYGWVPRQFSEQAASKYGWVQHHTGKSITELEIHHGVLADPEMHDHSLFFFRDPSFADDVPLEIRSVVEAEDADSAERLNALKQAIRDAHLPVSPMENYPCEYAGLRVNWRLAWKELTAGDCQALEAIAHDGLVTPEEDERLSDGNREFVRRHGDVYQKGLETFGEEVERRLWSGMRRQLSLPDAPTRLAYRLATEHEFALEIKRIEPILRAIRS
jgi:hypothetical protein